MTRELIRCENCTHDCDQPFRKAAAELLLLDDGTSSGLEKAERRETLLRARLHNIVNCTLSSTQISSNLDRLTEVKGNND